MRRESWAWAVAAPSDKTEKVVAPGKHTLIAGPFAAVARHHRPRINAILAVVATMERPRAVVDDVVAELGIMATL